MLKGQNEIRMIWLMALIIAGIGMWYAEIRQFSYLCALAFAISVMHYVDDLQKPAEQLAAEAGLPLEPTSKLPLYISSVMALAGSLGQIGFLTALGITAWIFFFLRWLKRLERNLFSIQQQLQRLSAVRNCTLFFTGQFGCGFPFRRHKEDRVVAKTTVSGRFAGNHARPASVAHNRRWIVCMAHIHQHTPVTRST